jgi:hypothetical protein
LRKNAVPGALAGFAEVARPFDVEAAAAGAGLAAADQPVDAGEAELRHVFERVAVLPACAVAIADRAPVLSDERPEQRLG